MERGVTFFDTAEVYGPFTNEELVGEALAPFREQVVIATKFGFKLDPNTGKQAGLDSRPEHIREVADASLKATQDRCHRSVLSASRRPGSADRRRRGSSQGPHSGKVRSSTSAFPKQESQTIRRAHAVQPVTALQSEYSLWWSEPETEIMPTLEELGIGFVPFSPLGKGYLTGKIDESTTFDSTDFRNIVPRFSPEARKANQAFVDLLDQDCRTEKRNTCSDRSCLGARSEAVDCSDSRNNEAAPASRKTSEPRMWSSRRAICRRSRAPPQRLRFKARGTRKTYRDWWAGSLRGPVAQRESLRAAGLHAGGVRGEIGGSATAPRERITSVTIRKAR